MLCSDNHPLQTVFSFNLETDALLSVLKTRNDK